MAVIPSNRGLDLRKARMAAGEAVLRRATASEVTALFPEFEPETLPPIGPHYPAPELLDWRLLQHAEVRCVAGHRDHHVFIDPRAIVELANPTVADLCED
jgi:prolyl-tRNA editing enzyme YbaK/EbsC (Cys-tRNA(Pro) deacylase)